MSYSPQAGGHVENSGLNTPMNEEKALVGNPNAPGTAPRSSGRRTALKWGIGALILAIIAVAVVVPVYFKVIKPNRENNSPASGHTGGEDEIPDLQEDGAITGGDGSTIFTLEGQFTYSNPHGGFWYFDPSDPLNNGAKAQEYTPAINETWTWGTDIVRGVNLGGWLVIEPFISPALFERYADHEPQPIDEYSLNEAMRANGTLLEEMEEHYNTFITEKDFADIAGAGLNWIRLPVGFWAIETFPEEPYLEAVSWKYVLRAITWARKYGLRINLDLHAHPGSQNGWNHSGYGRGVEGINWLNGVMGIANAQRSLDYVRIFTQFISQPQYSPVVPMFGIMNEPRLANLDRAAVETWNYQAYAMIREIAGTGVGNGPIVSLHDGFTDLASWYSFLTGADRLALDTHPYFAFDGANAEPIEEFITRPCTRWGDRTNTTQQAFGLLTSGEWSAAINDCGLFLTGVGNTPMYGGDCSQWDNWQDWDDTIKSQLRDFILASMDSLQNWFFWTWRIGDSIEFGSVRTPFWSYSLGLANGWIPNDPREAIGKCAELGVPPTNPFDGTFEPWQIGEDPDATPTFTEAYTQWPPASLGTIPVASYLPTYTPTASVTRLPGPVFTGSNEDMGDGWHNEDDDVGMMAPIEGCTYPDAYNAAAPEFPIPTGPVCGEGAVPLPTGVVPSDPLEVPTDITEPPFPTETAATDGAGVPITPDPAVPDPAIPDPLVPPVRFARRGAMRF